MTGTTLGKEEAQVVSFLRRQGGSIDLRSIRIGRIWRFGGSKLYFSSPLLPSPLRVFYRCRSARGDRCWLDGSTRFQNRSSLIKGEHHFLTFVYQGECPGARIDCLNLSLDDSRLFHEAGCRLVLPRSTQRAGKPKPVYHKTRQSEGYENDAKNSDQLTHDSTPAWFAVPLNVDDVPGKQLSYAWRSNYSKTRAGQHRRLANPLDE